MKKLKKIGLFVLALGFVAGVASCDNSNDDNSGNNSSDVAGGDSDNTSNEELKKNKDDALNNLSDLVKSESETDSEIKTKIDDYYNLEKNYVNGITTLEISKNASNKVTEDTKAFVNNELKPFVMTCLNNKINPLIEALNDENKKADALEYYNTKKALINDSTAIATVVDSYNLVLDDVINYINKKNNEIDDSLKSKALKELDSFLSALIDKIPYENLKTDIGAFYIDEKNKLNDVNGEGNINLCVSTIKKDLEEYALNESKKIAVSKLDEVINEGLNKIPNTELQNKLRTFANEEITKLNAVSKLELVPSTLQTVISETTNYIKELSIQTVKSYISRLTAVEKTTAYDYIPQTMQPSYQKNLVNTSAINYDFSNFTNVSNIVQSGYGEQWQMVIENVNQSVNMAKVFNVIQTVLNAAGNALDIYITNSYSEEIDYSFTGDSYTAQFIFRDGSLYFNIEMTSSVTVPGFGSVKPIIKMQYDLKEEAKGIFISLGDSAKIKYVISESGYEMATTYGLTIAGKNGSRSTYLSILKNDDKTTGHIYEYTTYEGSDKIKACADFYFADGYATVVGNKASGMVGFSGYINELYSLTEGRLLGYEVKEELTISGVKGTYNTLWFNLWDINGVNNVKVLDKTSENASSKSTVDVYLNSSSTLFCPTYNTKLTVKTSRKYDVELRNRYYYSYDEENDKYVSNEVLVPMMFIQQGDNLNSFENDIYKDNKIKASVKLESKHLNKILTDYQTYIDIFAANKEKMSSEEIIEYLNKHE